MNTEELLNIPYKTFKLIFVITFLLIMVLISILNIKVYDVYNTYAYYENSNIVLNIPITYSDTIINTEYFKITDKKYDFHVMAVSDVLLDSKTMVNYQEVIVSVSDVYPEKAVVKVSIYYNKEKVWKKIKKLL